MPLLIRTARSGPLDPFAGDFDRCSADAVLREDAGTHARAVRDEEGEIEQGGVFLDAAMENRRF